MVWRWLSARGRLDADAVLKKKIVVPGTLPAFSAVHKLLVACFLLLIDIRLVGNECLQREAINATTFVDVDDQLFLQSGELSEARRRRNGVTVSVADFVLKLVFGGVGKGARRKAVGCCGIAIRTGMSVHCHRLWRQK